MVRLGGALGLAGAAAATRGGENGAWRRWRTAERLAELLLRAKAREGGRASGGERQGCVRGSSSRRQGRAGLLGLTTPWHGGHAVDALCGGATRGTGGLEGHGVEPGRLAGPRRGARGR